MGLSQAGERPTTESKVKASQAQLFRMMVSSLCLHFPHPFNGHVSQDSWDDPSCITSYVTGAHRTQCPAAKGKERSDVVVHTCNPKRLRQEDFKFKASLGYRDPISKTIITKRSKGNTAHPQLASK
jgi:hypothetical protein